MDNDAINTILNILNCGNVAEIKREGNTVVIISKLPEKRMVLYRRQQESFFTASPLISEVK